MAIFYIVGFIVCEGLYGLKDIKRVDHGQMTHPLVFDFKLVQNLTNRYYL